MTIVYRIETPRLVVRCWSPGDAPLVKSAIDSSLDHLRPWMPWIAQEPQSLDEKVELLRKFRSSFDRGEDFIYGIFSKDETEVIGGTGLHTRVGPESREIGYWITSKHAHNGYAQEAAAALTQVALKIDGRVRVEIHCSPHNEASANVPRKLGYTHEATLRARLMHVDGTWGDRMIWTMLPSELEASPAARVSIRCADAAGRVVAR